MKKYLVSLRADINAYVTVDDDDWDIEMVGEAGRDAISLFPSSHGDVTIELDAIDIVDIFEICSDAGDG